MKYILTLLFSIGIITLNAQDLNVPLITVDASSIIYTAPNEVILHLNISKKGDTVKEARTESETQVKNVIQYLKSSGIPSKHIQTQYMQIGPKTNYKNGKIHYYMANQRLSVCLDKLENYDNIIDGLLELGVENINNPEFKTTDFKSIKDKARTQAMIKAREKAELLASALGQKIGKAKWIEDLTFRNFRNTGAYANSTESGVAEIDEDFSFAPGQIEVRASVKVSFELL